MEEWLQQLIDDDEYGLLNVKPKSKPISANQRLINSFREINDFVDKNGREPSISSDILENELYYKLEGIRENKMKVKQLKEEDRHNLLPSAEVDAVPSTMDDVFADDDMGMLDDDGSGLYNLQHGLSTKRTVGTFDYVAQRVKCADFSKYENLFKQCQSDIKNQKRLIKKFTTETSIKQGTFFVYKGLLMYIADVGKFSQRNTRMQARVHCIFENGTESDPLRNSLAKSMYSDGQIVTDNIDTMMKEFGGIETEDKSTGYIYVLKSLSRDPNVKSIDHLYKIGYSETTVENRIKNAPNEPTYLMAPVKIVASYATYNINTHKFEDLLHRFFSEACISIDVFDHNGKRHTVREWFQIPFPIIQQAIPLFLNGEIKNWHYSRKNEMLIEN